jgi:hypothetical protein
LSWPPSPAAGFRLVDFVRITHESCFKSLPGIELL